MTKTFYRRVFLQTLGAFSVLLGAKPLLAGAPATSLRPVSRSEDFLRQIQPPAEALIERAKLGGSVGFCVASATTGEVLETHLAERGQPPASVAKAITAAYALDVLGPGYHFETRIIATGPLDAEGIVQGDLVLAGGGDPTLDTDKLAEMAAHLKAAGLNGCSGAFKVWQGHLPYAEEIDAQQPPHVGYNPAVSGLNLNYNRVHFEWRKSGADYTVTMDARSETLRPAVRVARMRVEPRSAPIYTYSNASGRDNWTVAKGALGNGGARWLPVRKPALYAGEVFQSLAAAHGIKLSAPQLVEGKPEGSVLVTVQSPPLRIIVRDMLKWSTNLTAEVVGIAATQARGLPVSGSQDSAKAMNEWANTQFGLSTMQFVDHSGLGDQSRISASDMMSALHQLRQKTGIKALMKGFAMRDEKRKIIKDHPLSVQAKTGTLNFVSGLAGYVDLPDGSELVFAIFAANLDKRASLSVEERERPRGGVEWNRRAKALQQALIERWGIVYAA